QHSADEAKKCLRAQPEFLFAPPDAKRAGDR
ncbi:MAG: hypothetical protein ACI89D_001716, partial [Bermanella sp.]